MKVLLIRTADQAAETAQRLAELGHEAETLPLTRIVSVASSLPGERFDAIIFTSGHAPQRLAAMLESMKDGPASLATPAWCVGKSTADAARAADFVNIQGDPDTERGDAAALTERIASAYGGRAARLLYASGAHVARDLRAALTDHEVVRVIIYEARREDPGRPALESALRRCSGGAVLLYSSRSATHFIELVRTHRLEALLDEISAIAISPAVAATTKRLASLKVKAAATPDETAMLALLQAF